MDRRMPGMAVRKIGIVMLAAVIAAGTGACMNKAAEVKNVEAAEAVETVENPNAAIRVPAEEEHYIFDLDESVERTHVYYKNRFGIEIAADLYIAKDAEAGKKYPAIIIGPPFGGVKEQGPGVYANQLAQRGFIALAIDPAYHGYSGGSPRYTISTTMYAEDFSAAVDYLGNRDDVDREKIGVIGICGSGGFALSAAAMDDRIKAVVTSVMYDIAGNMNAIDGDARKNMIHMSATSRWDSFVTGEYDYMKQYPDAPADSIPDGLDEVNAEFFSFYGMARGWHPNALGNMNTASLGDIMTFPSNEHLAELDRPVLFVAGENAHSLGYSQAAYDKASEPKELYIVPDANHVDLYDQVDKIPFDKIGQFFKDSLK